MSRRGENCVVFLSGSNNRYQRLRNRLVPEMMTNYQLQVTVERRRYQAAWPQSASLKYVDQFKCDPMRAIARPSWYSSPSIMSGESVDIILSASLRV